MNATTTKTSTTAATPAAILALDLGKDKSVAFRYADDSAAACFQSLTTDRDQLRERRVSQGGMLQGASRASSQLGRSGRDR
jgi:hypothetical protein